MEGLCHKLRDALGNIKISGPINTAKCVVCRYWVADTYEQRHAAGLEPQNIDKEFIRLWFREHCDPYHDPVRQPFASPFCCLVMQHDVCLHVGCVLTVLACYEEHLKR